MEISQQSQRYDLELGGLKSLTLCSPTNAQKSAFSHIGDYIGTESCLDMRRSDDVQMMNVNDAATTSYHRVRNNKRESMKKATTREFPPPISLLARTDSFVLKRYYTNDGRLILREERRRRHEYISAHRSNGHLTLQLIVPLLDDEDDELSFSPFDDEIAKESQQVQRMEANVEKVDEEETINEGSGDQIPESCNDNDSIEIGGKSNGGVGGGGMCLKYNNAILSSSCYLGLPVPAPAIKPVHT